MATRRRASTPVQEKAPVDLDLARKAREAIGIRDSDDEEIIVPPPQRADQVRLQKVRCDLDGYKHIVATYRTNNRAWIAEQFRTLNDVENDEQLINLVCKFVMRIDNWQYLDENDQPVPVPDKDHPESWNFLFKELGDLSNWLLYTGYAQALRQSLGN